MARPATAPKTAVIAPLRPPEPSENPPATIAACKIRQKAGEYVDRRCRVGCRPALEGESWGQSVQQSDAGHDRDSRHDGNQPAERHSAPAELHVRPYSPPRLRHFPVSASS